MNNPDENAGPTQDPAAQPPAQPPYGQAPYGQQPPYGQAPPGQQPPYGQAPYGQAPPGQQPPYGQAPYGQAPYGQQPPYGQAPYGQAPYGQSPYGQPGPPRPLAPAQERTLAAAAHWGALVVGFLTSGLLAWLVPLGILLLKGKESAFVSRQATESLNFQITAIIYGLVSVVLTVITLGLAVPLLLVVGIWWLVFTILAAVKVNEGQDYRYPLILRLVS